MEDTMGIINQKVPSQKTTAISYGLEFNQPSSGVKGEVFFELRHPDNKKEVLHKQNIYTLDGGVLAAMLFSAHALGTSVKGPVCLAVGDGATGSTLNPDLADNRQRSLKHEVYRKAFSSTVFRTTMGLISEVPTNIVDFTTVFTESEANAYLNEMGLISHYNSDISIKSPVVATFPEYDTTVDLRGSDILVNYLTFPVISKIQGAVLAITWRLTF